jgi:hypothetical protein
MATTSSKISEEYSVSLTKEELLDLFTECVPEMSKFNGRQYTITVSPIIQAFQESGLEFTFHFSDGTQK